MGNSPREAGRVPKLEGGRRGPSVTLPLGLLLLGMFCSSEGLSQPSGLCHAAYYCTGGAVSPTPLRHKVCNTGHGRPDMYLSLPCNTHRVWDHSAGQGFLLG